MAHKKQVASVFVVIPNFNGAAQLPAAIDSVLAQSYKDYSLIIVDNGSKDDSRAIIEKYEARDKRVRSIYRRKNYGYTGGVNPGMELALNEGADFVAPFNNDAVADKDWLKHLVGHLKDHLETGIAACKLLHLDGKTFDSTADVYTIWGLPYPRGRDEPASNKYDHQTAIFGASGGASLYRVSMLREIGLFDQDFFAYYEDIDLSFRAHLTGWKVAFVPKSIVYHAEGMTSKAMASGFTTYQFMKNVPMVLVKDVPGRLWLKVALRLWLAYTLFFLNAVWQARGWSALKGWARGLWLLPKNIAKRRRIQRGRKVSTDYINSVITHDLPPNAHKLRKLRAFWWRFTGRR